MPRYTEADVETDTPGTDSRTTKRSIKIKPQNH
uniref:Uncharacterized protein n=1 Tax=Anguilla anguilla TaxID=7936 RepID=A0A0E9PBU3_ANGAN